MVKRLVHLIIRPRFIFAALLLGAVISALVIWLASPSDGLRVIFFDVGQGDAALVEFSGGGGRWLIDGGPDEKVIAQLDHFTVFSNRRLSGIILTHPHADHVTGLIHVLRRYQVERVLMPSVIHSTPEYLTFLEEVRARDIQTIAVDHPFVWEGWAGGARWRWEFLYPDKKLPDTLGNLNDASVVSRLTYGDQSFLFMGDASTEVENLLLAEGRNLESAVLKAGHHGSASSSSADFIDAVKPAYAVISAGEGNKFGHPAKETLQRINLAGIELYRTDKNGWIQFRTDGTLLTVSPAY